MILRNGHRLETCLAICVIAGIVVDMMFVYSHGYIPQPFFYEPSDTFADWFNPAHWARNPGTYDTWGSLYPPISFLLLRVLGLNRCYDANGIDFSAGLAARSCDWLGIASIFGFFILDGALIYFSFRKLDRSRAGVRTIAVALGFPMLDGLERGNLVLVTFACMVLAFGPLLRSFHARSFWAGCAVNFKVYMIAAIAPLILRRKWRRVEQYLLAVVIIYLATYAALGRGSLFEIADNIRTFANTRPQSPLDISLAGSYNVALELLQNSDFPSSLIMGSQFSDVLLFVLPAAVVCGQLAVVTALAASALRPEVIPPFRLLCLGILLAEITSEAGAYSIIYHAYFVMMEPWRGFGRKFAIVMCYLVAIPLEIPLQNLVSAWRDSYISGGVVSVDYIIGLVALLRPLATILIAISLSFVSIKSVWTDVRKQGWSKRWWLRNDVPILPGVLRPVLGEPVVTPHKR